MTICPFGQEIAAGTDGRPSNCFTSDTLDTKFTGQKRDSETGLDYFGARYFSGAQGRFGGADGPFNDQDPSDPQSWNLFSYGRNNPLVNFDPTGRACVHSTDAIGQSILRDDGQTPFCNELSASGNTATVTGQATPLVTYMYGNAVQRGDVDSSGKGDRIQNASDELLNLMPIGKALLLAGKVGILVGATWLIKGGAASIAKDLPFADAALAKKVAEAIESAVQGSARFKRDGIIFQNREGLLPSQGSGYYREFAVEPATGVAGRGAERIVLGQAGEVYYTPDHYGSFVRIK
jgi:RHS repeat-associated protein